MHFFMSGQNVTQRTFPYAHVMSFQCSEADTSVFRVLCQKRQQLISVGRWKVLRYTYLWRDEIERTAECPKVIVTDHKGNLLPDGEQSLPEKQRISVKAPYDGEVQILMDGFIIDKYKLMPERICEVEDILSDAAGQDPGIHIAGNASQTIPNLLQQIGSPVSGFLLAVRCRIDIDK